MSSENDLAATNDQSSQLMVKFVTKSVKYSVPDFPYSILASSNAETLNLLVKNILKEDASSKPDDFLDDLESAEFDFYVDGNFLDKTLNELIKSNEQIKTVT